MRVVQFGHFCLLAVMACMSPAVAEDLADLPLPTAHVTVPPLSLPAAFMAAQTAQTLQTIANMRSRLAELVPVEPRNDAVSQTAADFAAHWGAVIDTYADAQLNSVDAMIIGLSTHHQTQINDYMNAETLVPELSLFDDPDFMNMISMPIDFSNPLPTEAGFFGS